MKNKLFTLVLLFTLQNTIVTGQSPESFFPYDVGNRWDYAYWNGGFFEFYSYVITRDSLDIDGTLYLFYDNSNTPKYKIDSLQNVFWLFPACTYLLYDLRADSGHTWENVICSNRYGWVARIDSGPVFSKNTTTKQFEYGPVHPDSTPQPYALVKRWLSKGFGLIYEWEEPGVFSSLTGCVIAGDTFGTLVSVSLETEDLPKTFGLYQNYPNPFNPSTTIQFELHEAGMIDLTVYDLIGHQVATITEGKLDAGIHRFVWHAGALPSGVYFGRLKTQRSISTIKMLLPK